MLWSVNDTIGATVRATDGDIGTVSDVLFEDRSSTIRYLVVDTGGWLAGRQVLIAPQAFGEPDRTAGLMPVKLTREQVENSPDIATDRPVSRQEELRLHAYYDWAPYWGAPLAPGMGPYAYGIAPYWGHPAYAPSAEPEAREPQEPEGDPHLRSAREVIGYYIEATDGEIGHVEDLLADTGSWAVRYVVVDTKNWWPGKKVLVSPQWMTRVDWSRQEVEVDLSRETIKASPEYQGIAALHRDYEDRLHRHYGREPYWAAMAEAGDRRGGAG